MWNKDKNTSQIKNTHFCQCKNARSVGALLLLDI